MDQVEQMKNVLAEATDKYAKAFLKKDYEAALGYADVIRNAGLDLGSDAWNAALEVKKK